MRSLNGPMCTTQADLRVVCCIEALRAAGPREKGGRLVGDQRDPSEHFGQFVRVGLAKRSTVARIPAPPPRRPTLNRACWLGPCRLLRYAEKPHRARPVFFPAAGILSYRTRLNASRFETHDDAFLFIPCRRLVDM